MWLQPVLVSVDVQPTTSSAVQSSCAVTVESQPGMLSGLQPRSVVVGVQLSKIGAPVGVQPPLPQSSSLAIFSQSLSNVDARRWTPPQPDVGPCALNVFKLLHGCPAPHL